MITIPCANCASDVELPAEDVSPTCPKCKRVVKVQWFYSVGQPGTPRYFSAFDVWRNWMFRTGRVARSA